MKVLYSGFIDPSHSANGGYHKIINNPLTAETLLLGNYFLGKTNKKYRLRRIPLFLLDIDTRIQRRKYDITHLFYGEITEIPFIPYSKNKDSKTVITLHLDIEKQRFHKSFIKTLRNFDGVIVLSNQQKEYYKKRHDINATFIPHGFDAPTYQHVIPTDVNQNRIDPTKVNLIISGKNYRDFDTLEYAIRSLPDSDIHFHIVGAPANIKQQLGKYSNTHIYPRITDDEYYTLIEECDYNFLPLTFATANNALLEAQSIGTTSILPKIDGILDYAAPEPLNIFYQSKDHLIEILSKLDKNETDNRIIEFNKRFSWENIYAQLNQYYASLFT